ncbi:MAG: response regulator transcription factor [Candidatus Micrarchaeaceae archaeon]
MDQDGNDIKPDIVSMINDRQEVTFNELRSFAASLNITEELLRRNLKELETANTIASRSSGGIMTYYVLQSENVLRRIVIVEDDKNINKLMALSVGKGFDITQMYDGKEALEKIKFEKPDLVILDLMLPGLDGLEICQSIKRTASLNDIIVIIVSAMDATMNRFKGIKYGADYYIKKPFDPVELRSLVTIFLKKKGKKFDPLVDLPNEGKISDAVEKAVKVNDDNYELGKVHVDGLAEFAQRFGTDSGITILRLVSQLLQDKVRERGTDIFVGFLNGDDFVIAGSQNKIEKLVPDIKGEFTAVLPFIYQSEGYKPIELGIDDIYGADTPKLNLIYTPIEKDFLMEKRSEILKSKGDKSYIGSYTYEELRRMFGSENLDITITRGQGGVRLSIGKGSRQEG